MKLPLACLSLLACSLVGRSAAADCQDCTDASRHGSDCPPWAVCSVYAGDCESGKAPLSVCTGRCEAGRTTRVVLSAGVDTSNLEDAGMRLGLEIAPPVLGGHLAVRGEWWSASAWRAGPVVTWPVSRSVVLGLGVDAALGGGRLGAGASLRAELSPWTFTPGFIPAQLTSMTLEVGGLALGAGDDDRITHASIGLRLWI